MRKLFLIMMSLIALSWSVMAQTVYHGTVVDASDDEPLIGATILPLGGGQGVATDLDGKFTLSVPSNVHKITVRYVGYHEKTVNLAPNMKIALESSSQTIDDVVVVAYGTANKESLTGSVAVVGSAEIEDRPVSSVTAALEGNAPGVQVNNATTRPGESPSIRIRGFNSITGSSAPLYVVDGVVYDAGIADLNPADIESMVVLKDAASCALYGNRGANGVILINTKRAKKQGVVEVNLSVRQGWYERGLPFYDKLDADEWMETNLAAWAHGRYSSSTTFPTFADAMANSASRFVGSYLQNVNIYDQPGDKIYNPEAAEPAGLFTKEGKLMGHVLPGYNDLDWWKAVSRTGNRQEYSINATGATENFDAYASVGYLKEQGYMLQTDFERFSGRVVANYQPVNYFRFGTNMSVSHSKSQDGSVDSDELNTAGNPFLTEFNPPIQSYYAHEEDGSIIMTEDGTPKWNTSGLNKGNNVAWQQRLDQNDWTYNVINASVYGTAIIPYGFDLTVRGSMMRQKGTGLQYANNIIGSQAGVGGVDSYGISTGSDTFMQTLNWSHEYGDHHVDVMLDHENYEVFSDMTFLRKSAQLLPDNITLSNFENDDASMQSKSKIRTESYLGRVRYNYDQKYFGEFSLRRDGTSRFAPDNRWGTFWSVGGSWIITKEKFMQGLDWLDYLKLRAAYGSVGNDGTAGAYAYRALYSHGYGTYDGVGLLIPSQLAAANIKWEATKTLDVALEGSLFNDRFNFTVGYFDKRNSDLLYNVTAPESAGGVNNTGLLASTLTNIGTMANRGWEIQMGVDILKTKTWKWDFSVDASFVKNKILKLPNNKDIPGQALFQGYSLYEKYTYVWAGVDQMTGNSLYEMTPDSPDYWTYDAEGNLDPELTEAAYNADFEKAKNAGHLFEIDGKYYTDQTSYTKRRIMGSALPTVYGSFGSNVSWKGIRLSLLFTYSLGGKSMNGNYMSLMDFSNQSPAALHKDILKAWTGVPEGMTEDSPNRIDPNGVPVNDMVLSQYNTVGSSRFLVSNNYLTLKNLNVSYDLPRNWCDAMKLRGINIGLSADNVFIATRMKGFNPQYGFGGGQGAYYVPARVYSIQLNVKF